MRGDLPQGDDEDDGRGGGGRLGDRSGRARGPSGRVLLIVALVMVGIGYFLTVKLRDVARLQDCVMSGRSNCAAVADR